MGRSSATKYLILVEYKKIFVLFQSSESNDPSPPSDVRLPLFLITRADPQGRQEFGAVARAVGGGQTSLQFQHVGSRLGRLP